MKTNKIKELKINIKKGLFKMILKNNLNKLSEKNLMRIYDIYDVDYNLDEELEELNKEFRKKYVKNLLNNDFKTFKNKFGDFKTADFYIRHGRY